MKVFPSPWGSVPTCFWGSMLRSTLTRNIDQPFASIVCVHSLQVPFQSVHVLYMFTCRSGQYCILTLFLAVLPILCGQVSQRQQFCSCMRRRESRHREHDSARKSLFEITNVYVFSSLILVNCQALTDHYKMRRQ